MFLAGSIMLLVFWVITPLQSAIFNSGPVLRSAQTWMMITGKLIPVNLQSGALNANFLNEAYGLAWLNQSLPTFSTRQFAVLPFQPITTRPKPSPTETWTTTTDTFRTSLSCSPANISRVNNGFIFSS